MKNKTPIIIKASGERVPFSEEKIRESSMRAGVSEKLSKEIAENVSKRVDSDSTSEHIYKCVLSELRDRDPKSAYKYSLKNAIMQLGPTGFLFEKYVARILENYGYTTEVGNMVRGYCVEHEVDVTAMKNKKNIMIECKYHNRRGLRSDVKVALYTLARFLDIKKRKEIFCEPWLITNTKCTSQAKKYASCSGLRIIAWRYPSGKGLGYFIESKGLYPVTIIPFISKKTVQKLGEMNIILAVDLLKYSPEDLVKIVSISLSQAQRMKWAIEQICHQVNQ